MMKQKCNELDLSGYLHALVKNGKLELKGKDKGKGKARTCHECGAEDHLAAACPIRKLRVEQGEPERFDTPDVQMGKAGKK